MLFSWILYLLFWGIIVLFFRPYHVLRHCSTFLYYLDPLIDCFVTSFWSCDISNVRSCMSPKITIIPVSDVTLDLIVVGIAAYIRVNSDRLLKHNNSTFHWSPHVYIYLAEWQRRFCETITQTLQARNFNGVFGNYSLSSWVFSVKE